MASARSIPELSFAGFAGEKTDYVSGPTGTLARITNDVVTYLHPDHLGSAQAGTRANGTVAWREQYTPFGEQLQNPAANDNLGGFTGHIKDSATGLNYMQARYYDPVIGRFLSVDPVGFMTSGGNPGYFNRYSYTMNDPINLVDPTGMFSCSGNSADCESIHSAAEQAREAITQTNDALSDLSSALGGDAPLSDAQSETLQSVSDNFGAGNANAKGIARIQKRLGRLSDRIGERGTGAKVTVSDKQFGTGLSNGASATTSKISGNITVYQSAFGASVKNDNINLGGILIHEGGHVSLRTDGFFPLGESYGPVQANKLSKSYPDKTFGRTNNVTCLVTGGNCGG